MKREDGNNKLNIEKKTWRKHQGFMVCFMPATVTLYPSYLQPTTEGTCVVRVRRREEKESKEGCVNREGRIEDCEDEEGRTKGGTNKDSEKWKIVQ